MIYWRVAIVALLIAAVAIVVIVLESGGGSYTIRMRLADADGLRQGSPVAIGGQDIGTVSMSVRHDQVLVAMNIDRSQAPVGRNATVAVASVNLLGQKRIELYKGDIHDPAPSGYTLPASNVSVSADLDQVLDVLTPDVRARLAILINEAGETFAGREADFSQMLLQLPPDLNAGTELVDGIAADNHTLGDLVQTSDGFVSQLAAQRTQLNNAIHVFGQASATVASRRAQLAQTLAEAPGTLVTLQTFLGKLKNATIPLGPAAQDITATAPALEGTLGQLDPFRRAADPALTEATRDAPELTSLGIDATPVLRQATPVVGSLATFAGALQPISGIVNKSADNLVAILQNWSRAIQFRDGLSHVFRGEATITPQSLTEMIDQLQQAGLLSSLDRAAKTIGGSSAATAAARALGSSRSASAKATAGVPARGGDGTPGGATGARGSSGSSSAQTPTPPASPPTKSSPPSDLGSLLSYLLGR